MSEFFAYLRIGFDHITDPGGYDHILFIVALCAVYVASEWKKILLLVTAFTVGHSVTLALSVLDLIQFNTNLIEICITATIILTCFFNFFINPSNNKPNIGGSMNVVRYLSAICFGLIHGMGFSSYLKSLLGKDGFLMQLFAFNVGLEVGQLVVVLVAMIVTFVFVDLFKISRSRWLTIVSGIVFGMALNMFIERVSSILN